MVRVSLAPPEILSGDVLSVFVLCLAPVSAWLPPCNKFVTMKGVLEAVQDNT